MKYWFRDLYLTIRYGKWVVRRGERYEKYAVDAFLTPIKAEGDEVSYDPSYAYDYYAVCRRNADMILCESKREAEAFITYQNEARGI